MTPGKPIDFDKAIQKVIVESFNKGVVTISDAIIHSFLSVALRDGAVPRTFDAPQVVHIIKQVRAQITMVVPEKEVVVK